MRYLASLFAVFAVVLSVREATAPYVSVDDELFEYNGVYVKAWADPNHMIERWAWDSGRDAAPDVEWVMYWDDTERTAEGLLRICVSEGGWDGLSDCDWIWRVLVNIRSSGCERWKYPLITECVDGSETMVSAMRRASKRVMGMVPPKFRRQYWIRELTLDCERPPSFPEGVPWERYRDDCERVSKRAMELVTGARRPRTWGVPIAWGGRCEHGWGACDDWIGCKRGLARIPGTGTKNSFWCRPGTRLCPDYEPVCASEE